MRKTGLAILLFLFWTASVLATVPARLEYQGYLTDSVGTPIDCQGCTTPYNFKFSLYDQQVDGTLLWSELHAELNIAQGVFHAELGLQEALDAELMDGTPWLEIQVNDQAPMIPRQRLISVPYSLRASVAEHAIESENAASLGGQPVESFVQVIDTDVFVTESELADLLTDLGYLPGDNDALSDLLCAGGEIAQWDGTSWNCSTALDALQANVDAVQTNLDSLDAKLDPIAKDGLPPDLADGDDNTQLSEAEVLSMVSGAGYITGDHFSGAWADLSGVPADILDGDADTQLSEAQVDAFANNNGYALDADLANIATSGAWADLSGIPADIADGDTNTDILSSLGCSAGQIAEWTGSIWICAAGGEWTDEGSYLAASNATDVVVTDSGRVGVGTTNPATRLDVDGGIKHGNSVTCDASTAGTIRWTGTNFEGCDGTDWQGFLTGSAGVPAGTILAWGTDTVPDGYIECDGSSLSRTDYADLFAIIGTSYGFLNDGVFNVPDFRGEFLRGWSHGSNNDPDASSRNDRGDGLTGDNVGTLQGSVVKAHQHRHGRYVGGHPGYSLDDPGQNNALLDDGYNNEWTETTGSVESRPRNVNVMWVIKY